MYKQTKQSFLGHLQHFHYRASKEKRCKSLSKRDIRLQMSRRGEKELEPFSTLWNKDQWRIDRADRRGGTRWEQADEAEDQAARMSLAVQMRACLNRSCKELAKLKALA